MLFDIVFEDSADGSPIVQVCTDGPTWRSLWRPLLDDEAPTPIVVIDDAGNRVTVAPLFWEIEIHHINGGGKAQIRVIASRKP